MEKKMNILVATDYSEVVMNAEHYAVKMAMEQGAFLRFIHVFSPALADQTGSFDASKIDRSPALVELEKLKAHVKRLMISCNADQDKVSYECLVREGAAGGQLLEEIKESFPDMLIMGTHGVSGFRDLVLGSHTWQVIKRTSVPVLALPKDVSYVGIKNMVFATEYREGELPVINYLTQLAALFSAGLTVLHITSNALTQEYEKRVSDEFMNEMKNKIVYPDVRIKIEHATDVIDGLEKYTDKNKTDLLIMSHERPYFLERVFSSKGAITRKMTLYTHIPLLVIPDYYNPDYAWFWKLFALDYTTEKDI